MERAKFKGTYRIESARWGGHDYRAPGWYHVVICTKEHACTLGMVRNGRVGLSEEGCIVAEEWQKTPRLRPYVRLDAWIIMPNHVHGIIGITSGTPGNDAAVSDANVNVETPRQGVSTAAESRTVSSEKPLQPHSLGAIVGQVKSICTKRIRRTLRPDFAWQARFYDRIIRSERELRETRRYVLDNPLKWESDRNHPANW